MYKKMFILLVLTCANAWPLALTEVQSRVTQETASAVLEKAEDATSITLIDDARIAQAKAAIVRDFAINGYKRLACKTVAAAAATYAIYKVLEAQFAKPESRLSKSRSVEYPKFRSAVLYESPDPETLDYASSNDVPRDVQLQRDGAQHMAYRYPPTREEFDAFKDQFRLFQESIDPAWFTWPWVKNWGKSLGKGLVSMAITKGAFDVADRVINDIFHDGSIQWFFKTHTQTIETMNELNSYIQQLSTCEYQLGTCNLPNPEREHCKKQIVAVTNSFLRQISLLIAFIEYQRDQFPQGSPAYAESTNLSDYMRVCANDLGSAVAQALLGRAPTKSAGLSITKFASEFSRCINSFERIEKEQQALA